MPEVTGFRMAPSQNPATSGQGDKTGPLVVVSTAHPAKFPDAVEKATGIRPQLPPHLADLMTRPERVTRLPNDVAKVKEFVAAAAARHA